LLYTNPNFNDTFCSELTGYNKTEFTVKFLSNASNQLYQPYWVRDKLINELCDIASKNSESQDLQKITSHIIQQYPTVILKDKKREAEVTIHLQDQVNTTSKPKFPKQS
jgi:hypothetical protein